MSWTEHGRNQYIGEEIGVTSGTLLGFIKSKIRLFRTPTKTQNTRGKLILDGNMEGHRNSMKTKGDIGRSGHVGQVSGEWDNTNIS